MDDLVWDGANWMQAKIVPPTKRRKKGRKSVSMNAKRRIRTAGMTIPRLTTGDCVRFECVELGIYEFQILIVFWILHL